MPSDLELAQAVAAGDARAWNTFTQRYGDLVLSAVVSWCEEPYRLPRSQYDSILRTIRAGKPEPAEDPDMDREGLALYRYTMAALRPRLAEYTGQSSLGTFLRLVLRDVRRQYMAEEHGRLTVPKAVATLGQLEQDVYRLGTRLGDRRAIALRLNVDEAAVTAAERTVRRALQTEGKEWWALTSWEGAPALARCDRAELVAAHAERRLSATDAEALAAHVAGCPACAEQQAFLAEADAAGGIAPQVAAPTWVSRQVMDADGDAPEPQTAGDSWQRKVFAQPDWLAGLAVGAVATTLVLMVLIPQLEYQKAVREPGDVLIAQGYQPLEPKVAAQLSEARALLAKNRTDPAIQNLKAVLAARPENQEARWLLATTYDRLGDQYQAAQQYELFVDTERRERTIVDDRLKRAQSKLDGWKEVP
jgi:hypothetical protein